jgi:archaellum component FlaC
MTLDERIEALTMNLELAARDIETLKSLAQQDGEHTRALARIAETHDRL